MTGRLVDLNPFIAFCGHLAVVAGDPFALGLNYVADVAHLDVDWGDGGFASYPANVAPTYAFASPGYDLVRATATLTDGSTLRLPPKRFVVSPAAAKTNGHVDLPAAGT